MFDAGIERAIRTATAAHAGQTRKGSELPYITHPVHLALMLERAGAASVTVQAGLLHDVVEDCDDWTLERIEAEFGAEVTGIVAELTEDKTKSWEERKLAAAEKVATMSTEGALVKAVDQLHNLKALEDSLERAEDPAEVWCHFNGGREGTIDMATRLLESLTGRVDPQITDASASALAAIRG